MDRKGFTLIELMIAVSVLMIGTLMIQQGFLRCASLFHAASHRLAVETWMEGKLSDAREKLVYAAPPEVSGDAGTVELEGRSYDWSLEVAMLPSGRDLFTLRLSASWREDGRDVTASKESYVALRDTLL